MADSAGISCPVHKTLEIIGKRWTALIIRDLMTGKQRFSEMMRSLHGVTPKMLSQRLDELESFGIVTREVFAEVPPRVEYSLTCKGKDLQRLIDDMAAFGEKWLSCTAGTEESSKATSV